MSRKGEQESQPVPQSKIAGSGASNGKPIERGQLLDIAPVGSRRRDRRNSGSQGSRPAEAPGRRLANVVRRSRDRRRTDTGNELIASIRSNDRSRNAVRSRPLHCWKLTFARSRHRRRASSIMRWETSMAVIVPTSGARASSMRPIPQPMSSTVSIQPQQSPLGQTRHDLSRGAVENFGGAERIERDRGFRRDSDCPIELLADRSNRSPSRKGCSPAHLSPARSPARDGPYSSRPVG